MLLVTIFAVTIGSTLAGVGSRSQSNELPDCSELPDGPVYVGGCGSYGLCQNGQFQQVDCTNGTVVHTQSFQCVDPSNALYPCNQPPQQESCLNHVEHPGYRLPVIQQDPQDPRPPCSVYYTCTYGQFLPYQWCPEGTVYDEENQRCEDPVNVAPPCGYAAPSPGTTSNNNNRFPGNQGVGNFNQFGQGQGQGQFGGGRGQGQVGGGGRGQGQNQFGGQGQGLGQGQGQGQGQFGGGQGQGQSQGQGGFGPDSNQSPFARSLFSGRRMKPSRMAFARF